MKRWVVLGMAVALLSTLAVIVWTGVVDSTNSPIEITRLENETHFLHHDKSGTRRSKVTGKGEIVLYQYVLEAGKKTRSSFDSRGSLIVSIAEGNGFLQTARLGEKNELVWFDETPVSAGDYFSIPSKVVYQFEASPDEPLKYLVFSSKGSQQKDREFLREEHLSSLPHKRRNIITQRTGEIETESKSSQGDKDPSMVPDMLKVDKEGDRYSYDMGEVLELGNATEVASTIDHDFSTPFEPYLMIKQSGNNSCPKEKKEFFRIFLTSKNA